MNTSDEIESVAAAIETLLHANRLAVANTSMPARIKFLAARLSSCDHDAAEKAYEIASLASIFYSARKHMTYPGGSERLWAQMTFELLGRIRGRARSRAASNETDA